MENFYMQRIIKVVGGAIFLIIIIMIVSKIGEQIASIFNLSEFIASAIVIVLYIAIALLLRKKEGLIYLSHILLVISAYYIFMTVVSFINLPS